MAARKNVTSVPTEPDLDLISLDDLELDRDNPRLPHSVRGKDDQTIIDFLVRKGNVSEIMESIGHNDFFSGERILVAKKAGNKKFTVVEGNCRFAACLLLKDPSKARVKPKTIKGISEQARYKPSALPCLVYPSREVILPQLGFRHITGITEWSPLQKARYFQQIRAARNLGADRDSYRAMATEFGSGDRWDYVAGSLTTLKLFEKIQERSFFEISGLDEQTLSFSVLNTALNYENIVRFLELKDRRDEIGADGVDIDRLQELTRWLFEVTNTGHPRVPESRQLRALSEVVANGKALDAFRKGKSLDIAQKMTDLPQKTVMVLVNEAKAKISAAYEIAREATFTIEDVNFIRDFSTNEVRSLFEVVKGRVPQKDPFDME